MRILDSSHQVTDARVMKDIGGVSQKNEECPYNERGVRRRKDPRGRGIFGYRDALLGPSRCPRFFSAYQP